MMRSTAPYSKLFGNDAMVARVATVWGGGIIQGLFKDFQVSFPNLFRRCFTTWC